VRLIILENYNKEVTKKMVKTILDNAKIKFKFSEKEAI
jgi:hypothetical protein